MPSRIARQHAPPQPPLLHPLSLRSCYTCVSLLARTDFGCRSLLQQPFNGALYGAHAYRGVWGSEYVSLYAVFRHSMGLRLVHGRGSRSPLLSNAHWMPRTRDLSWMKAASSFENIPSEGVHYSVDGVSVLVGNRKLMLTSGVSISDDVEGYLQQTESQAGTGILVAFNGAIAGVVGISNPLKLEAHLVVKALQRMGIRCVMVTGDNWGIAKSVAREVGIDKVYAEVLPGGKVDIIHKLQSDGIVVAMVGDGVNDSLALAASDLGIAIGAGTDIAIEAADYVLMRNSLEDVITAIDLSQKTFARIKLNYAFAMDYNVLAIPGAVGVFFPWCSISLPPWAVGAVMASSSVSVVCSSLLLRRYTQPRLTELLQVKIQRTRGTQTIRPKARGLDLRVHLRVHFTSVFEDAFRVMVVQHSFTKEIYGNEKAVPKFQFTFGNHAA